MVLSLRRPWSLTVTASNRTFLKNNKPRLPSRSQSKHSDQINTYSNLASWQSKLSKFLWPESPPSPPGEPGWGFFPWPNSHAMSHQAGMGSAAFLPQLTAVPIHNLTRTHFLRAQFRDTQRKVSAAWVSLALSSTVLWGRPTGGSRSLPGPIAGGRRGVGGSILKATFWLFTKSELHDLRVLQSNFLFQNLEKDLCPVI